jgi:hypothetical protein
MMLNRHLAPAFGHLRLDEIGPEQLDKYKANKLSGDAEKKVNPLAPKTINNHLTCLATILVVAVEWKRLPIAPKIRKRQDARPRDRFLDLRAGGLVGVGRVSRRR